MKIDVFERQILAIGLTLAGHPVKGDKARMTKLNARRFKSKYGSSPAVLVKIWLDLKKFNLLNETDNNPKIFKMF